MLRNVLNRIVSVVGFAGMAVSATAQSGRDSGLADGVMRRKTGDVAMARAIQRARAGLPDFLSLAENPREGMHHFSVKVGIPVDPDVEYVWVRPFSREGQDFKGRLVNDATIMPNLNYGQWIIFDEVNIVDWSYRDGERNVGNQTACALMRTLPLAEQAAFKHRYNLTCDP